MKETVNGSTGSLRRRDEIDTSAENQSMRGRSDNGSQSRLQTNGHARPSQITLISVLDLVMQRWHWLVLGTACGATVLYLLASKGVQPKFTASAQLMRYEAAGKSEAFKTAPVSGDTFAAIIRAPELLKEVCLQALPPISVEQFSKSIKIDPDPDSDVVTVQLASRDPRRAVDLVNLYITNAVQYTLTLEAKQAARS